MSYRITEDVIRVDAPAAGLPSLTKLLLAALASHAKDDGTEAHPSINTLARETGLSERTVQRSLRELEMNGLVEAVKSWGRYRPVVYRIDLVKLAELPSLRKRRRTMGAQQSPMNEVQGCPGDTHE